MSFVKMPPVGLEPTTFQLPHHRPDSLRPGVDPVSGQYMGSQADALPLSYGGFVHLLNLLKYV
jgi:hypothetical protein